MLDVGSGNSKGTYLNNSQSNEHTAFNISLGTLTFTDLINNDSNRNEDNNFGKTAERLKKDKLLPDIREIVQTKPGMQTLSRVYLAGGISWAIATLVRPCQPEQSVKTKEERVSLFLRMYPEDINTFYFNAIRDQKNLYQPDLSSCTDEQRERAEKDIEIIKKTFTIHNLIAGAEIIRAFSDELYFSQRERLFFSRFAYEALPIGYLKQQLDEFEN